MNFCFKKKPCRTGRAFYEWFRKIIWNPCCLRIVPQRHPQREFPQREFPQREFPQREFPQRVLLPWRCPLQRLPLGDRSEEHTSELQSLMRISYDVFCLKKKTI